MRQHLPTISALARPAPRSRHALPTRALGGALLPWLLTCLTWVTLPAVAAPLNPDLEALQAFEQASAEIKQRRFAQAEILLERVLMLQPEHAEARIELALLMAGRGHHHGAQALLQSLIDDPRTDLAQAQELKNLQTLIQQGGPLTPGNSPYALQIARLPTHVAEPDHAAQPTASWRGEINLGLSSNPLARTAAQAITITLPDGPLSLPLAQTERSGAMTGANLSRSTETGGFELALQGTNVSGASTASRAVAWGRLPLTAWHATSQLPPVLAYAQVQRGLDGQHRAQLGLTAIQGQQKYSLSNYHEYSTQDHGLIWRLEHHQPRWLGVDWFASLERSQSTTGPQAYWRAAVAGEHPVNAQGKMSFQFIDQKDTYVYSSLLENGARRSFKSLHVAYEQQHPLKDEKTFVWRVFTGERRSNLSLFAYKEVGFQLSLVNKWR